MSPSQMFNIPCPPRIILSQNIYNFLSTQHLLRNIVKIVDIDILQITSTSFLICYMKSDSNLRRPLECHLKWHSEWDRLETLIGDSQGRSSSPRQSPRFSLWDWLDRNRSSRHRRRKDSRCEAFVSVFVPYLRVDLTREQALKESLGTVLGKVEAPISRLASLAATASNIRVTFRLLH